VLFSILNRHCLSAFTQRIHPGRSNPWRAAGMSRSGIRSRFKGYSDQTPLEYVTEWRMQKASSYTTA